MATRKYISKSIRLKVYDKYNGHCAYCGCKLELKDMQVDHIESVYWYNGANNIENYNPACRMCNFYKSTMPIEDFRGQLGELTSRLEKTLSIVWRRNTELFRKSRNRLYFILKRRGLVKSNERIFIQG